MPSAYEALQRLKAAQKVRREAKEKWDAAFDQFLEDSQRPLGLRDLMFALAVIARIVDRALGKLQGNIVATNLRTEL
jgi:hypothetical protein